jgi:hypothetical protein
LADDPQQVPDSCASAAVPQQTLVVPGVDVLAVAAGVEPQHPPAAGGLKASAGSPANLPDVAWLDEGAVTMNSFGLVER